MNLGLTKKAYLHLLVDAQIDTDQQLSDLSGVSRPKVNGFKLGKSQPPETVSALLNALLARSRKFRTTG